MLKYSIVALIFINSLYASKTIEVEESLKKNFAKNQTYQIRLALADRLICHEFNLCEKVNPAIYSLISHIKITSKTFSETLSKDLTIITLDVLVSHLNKRCSVQMKLQPKYIYVTDEGDLEEHQSSWIITDTHCLKSNKG